MNLATWGCSRCGHTEDFPDNEQPLAIYVCMERELREGPICGGLVEPLGLPVGEGVTVDGEVNG